MKRLINKIKPIFKKIDYENLRTQIGISVLFGLVFGLLMSYNTYTQSMFASENAMIKNIKVSKKYYEKFPKPDLIVKELLYNFTAAVTMSLGIMSLFLIFKPKSK